MLQKKKINLFFTTSGIDNRFNTIESRLLSLLFSYYRTGHNNVRGANLSFWKDDLIATNGFNEDFIGWGREDSEFAVRMTNMGIRRKHLKFAGFGYHLFHPENSRQQLSVNDQILERTIKQGLRSCENGIHKSITAEVTSTL
jgi:hypothetical protein